MWFVTMGEQASRLLLGSIINIIKLVISLSCITVPNLETMEVSSKCGLLNTTTYLAELLLV